MNNTDDISTITTIAALIIMTIITGVGAHNVFSAEPAVHESPIWDVIKSLLIFDFATIIGGSLLIVILIRLGIVILAIVFIGGLVIVALGAIPFLAVTLPIVGIIVLLVLYLAFSFAVSKEADAAFGPIQDEIGKKCFYILIAVNIFGSAILYNAYTNPNGNMWEFKPAVKAEENISADDTN